MQLPGDFKLLPTDTALDFKQLLRHLADATPSVPQWRQHRPALLVEAADFHVPQAKPEGAPAIGTLLLRGYVRGRGLSANQAVHIAGAGDFQLAQIDGISEPPAANELAAGAGQRRLGMDAVRADEHQLVMLARPDAQRLESLARENLVDPLAGEQTWPTEEVRGSRVSRALSVAMARSLKSAGLIVQEVMEAEAGAARRKRRLPRGTSDYQAAWILDDRWVCELLGSRLTRMPAATDTLRRCAVTWTTQTWKARVEAAASRRQALSVMASVCQAWSPACQAAASAMQIQAKSAWM